MKKILPLLALLALSIYAKPHVSVSILPQKYFVQQIAKDTLDVNVLVPKGASPATYEPKPKQMSHLSKSEIYFAIGVGYEKNWLKRFAQTFPKLHIVKTQKGVKKMPMLSTHKHHKTNLDPHIWLDPILVQTQAKNIASALIKKYPQNKDFYEKNLQEFLLKLENLHVRIQKMFLDKKKKTFLIFHPSWGYFASRYGLTQKAIEIEGKEPKPKDLQRLINEVKKDNLHVIFAQPQFSQKAAKVIAKQINAKLIFLDNLSEDWENELVKSALLLSQNLGE